MKKTVSVILGALMVLVVVGFACGKYACHTARQLEESLEKALAAAETMDFDLAGRYMEDFLGHWEKREKIMQLFSVHEDIDHVDELADSLVCAIREEDKLHILLEGARLRHAVCHLYHRDAPDVTNIF